MAPSLLLPLKHGSLVNLTSFTYLVQFWVAMSRCNKMFAIRLVMQAQDYLFVRAFVPFAASVLIKAWKESDCRGDMEVILGGVASLEDEISWFKAEANKWGISLSDVVPQPPNKNYYR